MKKRIFAILLVLALIFSFAACGEEEIDYGEQNNTTVSESVNVGTLKGPTGLGMGRMFDAYAYRYKFTISTMPDDIASGLISGSLDFAALPLNLASVIWNKTSGGIRMLAINTLGVLYILEQGDSVKSVADLKGKTIYASGLGSSPEYILDYILTKNGIDPEKDVKIEYKADHAEVTTLAASGADGVFLVPEPNVSVAMSKNEKLRVALDITQEWNAVSTAKLAQGCIAVRTEFAEKNPDEVEAFLKAYEESVTFVNTETSVAASLAVSAGIIDNAQIAEKAIPRCNITFITGAEMKAAAVENFTVLFGYNPKSVGGAMPDDNFYYGA